MQIWTPYDSSTLTGKKKKNAFMSIFFSIKYMTGRKEI